MNESPERKKKLELLKLLDERNRRNKYNKIKQLFPDEGPFRRELYQKHLEFFRAGAVHRERLFMAGNRVGKTIAGGCELTYHLTGDYPDWWEGEWFDRPVKALAAGDTGQTTRDIIQEKLLGDYEDVGSGLIPKEKIHGSPTRKPGVPKAYEEVKVKHSSGGYSTLMLRSYDQGRRIFQGFEADVIWFDEEVPEDVYSEGLVRTMTTNGLLIMTFTPLMGMTPLVLSFMESADLL